MGLKVRFEKSGFLTSKYKNKVPVVYHIAEYNFAIYFLSNAL